jgi:hypothetical protein
VCKTPHVVIIFTINVAVSVAAAASQVLATRIDAKPQNQAVAHPSLLSACLVELRGL